MDALAVILKTIELAVQSSHLYWPNQKYQLFIERVVEGYVRATPPTIPQLAVTVTFPREAYNKVLESIDMFILTTGCLIIVSFTFYSE